MKVNQVKLTFVVALCPGNISQQTRPVKMPGHRGRSQLSQAKGNQGPFVQGALTARNEVPGANMLCCKKSQDETDCARQG